ncbi:MAG TPA: hypothetical protein VFQ22_03570, partial [Longimicrobiales bacterium]|nr:hypothetical protein [Longimicrobiales bacterium]
MEVDLALLADAATIDGSGKLNILGVFDRLAASSFPTRHPRMSLVLRFAAGVHEMGRHQVGISLRSPGGKEVVRIDGEMSLLPNRAAAGGAVLVPHVLNMDGIVFPVAGRYTFDVRVDGKHQASIPLTV